MVAPVVAVMMTDDGTPFFASFTMSVILVLEKAVTVAATLSRVTDKSFESPASSDRPVNVTREPRTPLDGSTFAILPSVSCVYRLVLDVTCAPVFEVITTLPAPAVPVLMTTTACVSEPDAMLAAVPAMVMDVNLAPPPSMAVPVMVTLVLSWPVAGATALITATSRYSKPSARVVVAPVSALSTTSPLPLALLPATTVTLSSASLVMDAVESPSCTLTTFLPPPCRLLPAMTTVVLSWPSAGLTLAILLCVRYVHSLSALVVVAPLSITMVTTPLPGLPAAAITAMALLLKPDTIFCTAVPASLTVATKDAPASMFLPLMTTTVPTWPLAGVAALIVAGPT